MDILLFGITKDIIGSNALSVPDTLGLSTVGHLKSWLAEEYPAFKDLSSLAVAVGSEYAEDEQALSAHQEIALIPPVSGG